mgnify:CR=1 FL=1
MVPGTRVHFLGGKIPLTKTGSIPILEIISPLSERAIRQASPLVWPRWNSGVAGRLNLQTDRILSTVHRLESASSK